MLDEASVVDLAKPLGDSVRKGLAATKETVSDFRSWQRLSRPMVAGWNYMP